MSKKNTQDKKHIFNVQLNALESSKDDPTIVNCEFILHDFSVSKNYAFITKETAEKALFSLEGKPIVTLYKPVSAKGEKDDGLGSHEVMMDKDREDGTSFVTTGTLPIGVFTEPAYIETITDENGEDKEVVIGKGILWASRFPNVVGLLKEWMDNGVTVGSSMEILYNQYEVKDGITEIKNFYYDGHALLQSEDTERFNKVYPAYDASKLTKLVAQAVHQLEKEDDKVEELNVQHNEEESTVEEVDTQVEETETTEEETLETQVNEDEKQEEEVQDEVETDTTNVEEEETTEEQPTQEDQTEFYAQLNEMSHNDIYRELRDQYREKSNKESWAVDVYETYAIFEEWDEDYTSSYFKVEYSKSENGVVLNYDSKSAVEEKREWVNVERQMSELTKKNDELTSKLSESTEMIVQLNEQIGEMKPIHEQYIQEQFETKVAELSGLYQAKFEKLGAGEKFKTEEVLKLINEIAEESDKSVEAKLQLNTMLVDLVEVDVKETSENTMIRQLSSRRENLIPEPQDFMSRYK